MGKHLTDWMCFVFRFSVLMFFFLLVWWFMRYHESMIYGFKLEFFLFFFALSIYKTWNNLKKKKNWIQNWTWWLFLLFFRSSCTWHVTHTHIHTNRCVSCLWIWNGYFHGSFIHTHTHTNIWQFISFLFCKNAKIIEN